jgi:hypothetical protein
MASPAVKAAADASRHRSPQVQTGEPRLRMLKADCAFFASEVLGIEIGDHHQEWSELQRKHLRLSIEAARGHGKSGFWSYAYPLWQSWRTAGNGGLIVSDTDGQVQEFFRIIKEGKRFTDKSGHTFELRAACDVPEITAIMPHGWERSWTGSKIAFANGSRFEGKTFGTRFRGRHVLWMVVDDGIGDDAAYSERAREKDWDFFTRALSPMILPGGQLVDVGTPLHADDLHGRLGKNGEYVKRKFPGLSVVNGREVPLWPEFRSLAWHKAERARLGELAYNQEVLLQPATSEASLFPLKLFSKHPETLAHGLCVGLSAQDIADRGWSVFFGVDVAQSAEVGADYFVICVMAVDPSGTRYIIDLFREKGLPFHQQLSTLEDWAVRHEPDMIYIEANASQRIYGDEMIRKTDLPIGKFVTSAGGKNSLDTGVLGLRPLIENGKLRLARGNAESIQKTDVLIAELGAFAWVDGKLQGVGAHDDTVMATWIADQAVRASRRFTLWTATADEEGAGVDEADDDPYAEQPAAVDEDADFVDLPDEDEPPTPAPPPAPRPATPKPGAPRLAAPVPQRPYDPDADELYDEPPAPKPRRAPSRTARSSLAQLGQGHVDAQLATVADDLPDDRQVWIDGWNAMMTGSEMPGPVARALKTHGHAPVRALLARLLGV